MAVSSSLERLDPYRRVSRGGALVAMLAGAVALSGWILDVDLLKSVVPGQVTMKVNTALCLLAAGGAALALSGRPSRARARWARGLAGAVMLLASAVLSQYVTGRDLGIDQALFVEAAVAVGTVHPNRMAPNTALAFVLIGAALALLDVRVCGRWRPANALAALTGALALAALVGYFSGVTSLYGVRGFTQMAVPTTVAFLGLALSVCFARPAYPPMRRLTSATPGGAALRRLIPAVVVIPIGLGALRLAGQQAGLYPTVVGVWLMVLSTIALALVLTWRLAGSLDRADAHRRDADALRESEERARRIVDTACDAFIATDAGGRIIGWNAAAERPFGYTAAEARGADMAALIVPDRLRDAHERGINRVSALIAHGDPAPPRASESIARDRHGREFPVELVVAAVVDTTGLVFNAFLRDITERRRAHDEVTAAQQEVLHRLALAAEYRDDDTGQHTRRVGDLSARLAERIGLPAAEVDLIRRAAPLHDVGKIGVSDAILLKPGPLTAAEFAQVKAHTVIGAKMLGGRGFPLLEVAEQIAVSHHERWDGSGYPHGLAGEEIPLVGRIVALADVFDALTHDRPYKSAWSIEESLDEIRRQRGRQFDPDLAETFVELITSELPQPPSRDRRNLAAA